MKSSLHPGAKWVFRLRVYIYFVIFFLFILFSSLSIFLNLEISFSLWLISFLVIAILIGEIFARLSYRFWTYDFGSDSLRIERGIIWRRSSNIPYERIQNVDIHRGVFARMLGFSTVIVQTAGYSGGYGYNRTGISAEGTLPAIALDDAEKIRDFLIKKIGHKGKGM